MSDSEKWTATPRRPDYSGYSGFDVVTRSQTKSGRGGLAIICRVSDLSDAEQTARLISAAPEMRAALLAVKTALCRIDFSAIPGGYATIPWDVIEQAIQKTTGGTNDAGSKKEENVHDFSAASERPA